MRKNEVVNGVQPDFFRFTNPLYEFGVKRKVGYMEEAESKLIDFITKNGSWLDADYYNALKSQSGLKIPRSGYDISNNAMLLSLEFENMIENSMVYQNINLKSQREGLEISNGILGLIEAEINDKK